ncbi:hypothetical protein Q8A73_011103 [Channa argus]|nr:hypothetical protein Q8A73_011103 [Channa argus]
MAITGAAACNVLPNESDAKLGMEKPKYNPSAANGVTQGLVVEEADRGARRSAGSSAPRQSGQLRRRSDLTAAALGSRVRHRGRSHQPQPHLLAQSRPDLHTITREGGRRGRMNQSQISRSRQYKQPKRGQAECGAA